MDGGNREGEGEGKGEGGFGSVEGISGFGSLPKSSRLGGLSSRNGLRIDELDLGESGLMSGDWIVAGCEVFACCFAGERTRYSVTAVPTITTTERPTAASTESQGNVAGGS